MHGHPPVGVIVAFGSLSVAVGSTPDDHKAYNPGATRISIRVTGDRTSQRLLGAQLVGHAGAEIAKRVDILATAIHNDMTVDAVNELDLSYSPPLGSPWDAVQMASQTWARQARAHRVEDVVPSSHTDQVDIAPSGAEGTASPR